MTGEAASRRTLLRTYEKQRENGDLTEIEFEHQRQRLELDYEWDDTKDARVILGHERREAQEQVAMAEMIDFMETRPAELLGEAYERSMADLKKKQAQ